MVDKKEYHENGEVTLKAGANEIYTLSKAESDRQPSIVQQASDINRRRAYELDDDDDDDDAVNCSVHRLQQQEFTIN